MPVLTEVTVWKHPEIRRHDAAGAVRREPVHSRKRPVHEAVGGRFVPKNSLRQEI